MHRDSEGNALEITPGAMNLMTAGRGIAHSERSPLSARQGSEGICGIQSWIALPQAQEETDPSFQPSRPSRTTVCGPLPVPLSAQSRQWERSRNGSTRKCRSLRGRVVPLDPDPEERAIYVVEGEVEIAGETFGGPRLLVFHPGGRIAVRATHAARMMFLGGAALEGHVTFGGTSYPRAGNGSSKPEKIRRPGNSRRCRAKQRVHSASRFLGKSQQLGNQILAHWCANSALFGHAATCTYFITTVLKGVRST
jgi:hypothetical protein